MDRPLANHADGLTSVLVDLDDNGNLIERGTDFFDWDYEDRMVSATVNSIASTFAYRGDGLRHSRTTGMTTTTFTWDIASGLPTVIDDGNQYVYGVAGLNAMKQGGNWYYYLADGLGSTMAVVNASGVVQNSYSYDVYGEASVTGALANEFDFAGQQTDSTGLQYLRARYMDPETGTFFSRDPLTILPHWFGNGLGYVSANPTGLTDPTGLCALGDANCVGLPPLLAGIEVPDEGSSGIWWEARYDNDTHRLNVVACVGKKGMNNDSLDCAHMGNQGILIREYEECSVFKGHNLSGDYQGIQCRDTRTGEITQDDTISHPTVPSPTELIIKCIIGLGLGGVAGTAAGPGYGTAIGAVVGCVMNAVLTDQIYDSTGLP